MKAIVVKTNGDIEVIDQEWNYDQINKAVGGWIEVIRFAEYPDHFAYINEEGKIIGLEPNELVTQYWYESGTKVLLGDYIAGDAVFFGEIDDEGNNTDVPGDVLLRLNALKAVIFGGGEF